MPLKVFSQDAEVCLLCNIPREDAEQEEEEEEMAASQVRVLSRAWGCVCFSWTERTYKPLILYSYFFGLGCLFPTIYFSLQ